MFIYVYVCQYFTDEREDQLGVPISLRFLCTPIQWASAVSLTFKSFPSSNVISTTNLNSILNFQLLILPPITAFFNSRFEEPLKIFKKECLGFVRWSLTLYNSGSQPGCRGTLECREEVPGVPPNIVFSCYLLVFLMKLINNYSFKGASE